MNTNYVLYLPGRHFDATAMPLEHLELVSQRGKPRPQGGGNFATSPANYDALARTQLATTSGMRRVPYRHVGRSVH